MIRRVEKADILAQSNIHGVIGFGLPDGRGNYEKGFLRMVQEELDLSHPTVMMAFINKSMIP
jgi:hypothetical protein